MDIDIIEVAKNQSNFITAFLMLALHEKQDDLFKILVNDHGTHYISIDVLVISIVTNNIPIINLIINTGKFEYRLIEEFVNHFSSDFLKRQLKLIEMI